MKPCVYILASRKNGLLYIGVTANVRPRLDEHREGAVVYTRRNRIRRLVYFESHGTILDAIRREKQLKFWRRAWKINLIESVNPNWHDRTRDLVWFD